MKNYDLITPEGTKDLLFGECIVRRNIENTLMNLFKSRGYSETITPGLEFYDVFNLNSRYFPQENLYKLTDSKGRLLVMRPDTTMPIARIVATRLRDADLPLKLCYAQAVYTTEPSLKGRSDEVVQAGIELIGSQPKMADLEVISTAVDSLNSFGMEFSLELGHIGIFKELVGKLDASEQDKESIRKLIENKNFPALNDMLDSFGVSPVTTALKKLPALFGGEEVFEITVPENVTKINAALFEGFRYITTIHMHDGITSIGNGAFNDCRSLNHTFEEMLPSSVTSIGNFAFHNCNSLHGDLIFSDTVRSIGSDAFSNIQNNNLGNVVVPSTVTSLGDTFIQYDKFKNITIYSRGGNNLNNRLVKEVGDGTGTLTFVPDFLETGNNSSDIRVKNFIFGGSYTFNWPSGERILFNGGATLDKIILTGSLTSNGISSFTNQVRQLKFISIGGEITNLKKLFYADNANMYNGVIMNFRYEGVATTPAVACASYSRLAKIYVGDGSSEEHDQAIYDLYAADTGEGGWNDQTEGGTSYMNKLDLWYNYHGQYRQE